MTTCARGWTISTPSRFVTTRGSVAGARMLLAAVIDLTMSLRLRDSVLVAGDTGNSSETLNSLIINDLRRRAGRPAKCLIFNDLRLKKVIHNKKGTLGRNVTRFHSRRCNATTNNHRHQEFIAIPQPHIHNEWGGQQCFYRINSTLAKIYPGISEFIRGFFWKYGRILRNWTQKSRKSLLNEAEKW